MKAGLPFARLDDWRRTFSSVEVNRRDKVNGVDAWVVRLSGTELPPSTRYVSIETGLTLREDTWITARGVGTVPMTVKYSDYRSVAGVMLPFHVETTSAVTGVQVIQYTQIK